MDYPTTLLLSQLEATHKNYKETTELIRKIEILYKGGDCIEDCKEEFLVKRLDEDPKEYSLRLSRFVYTNVLASSIAEITSKFSTGTLTISGISDSSIWDKFREDVDGKGTDEKSLITDVFRSVLRYKTVYALVDKPYSEFKPVNKLQEEQLGLNKAYIVLYSPLEVINYANDGSWYKIRTVEEINKPFGESIYRVTWKIIDSNNIAEYSTLAVLDDCGKIIKIVDDNGNETGVDKVTSISLSKPVVNHKRGKVPVVKLELPDEKYVCNQVYLKSIQHLNIENALTDTAISAGYVQRTFEPNVKPDSDLETTVDDKDSLPSSNARILKGKFEFKEINGASIDTNRKLLDQIEHQIRVMVSLAGASATREALQQSAVSKAVDLQKIEHSLRSYGSLITRWYQDVLQLIALTLGLEAEVSRISVLGLDSFEIASLEEALTITEQMQPFENKIAPTARKMHYQHLAKLLNPNASAEESAIFMQETEAIFNDLSSLEANTSRNTEQPVT